MSSRPASVGDEVTRTSISTVTTATSPATDGEHAIQLLDALNAPEFDPWTLVDAPWTSNERVRVSAGNRNSC